MLYEYNGKMYRIEDNELQKSINMLGITEEEAIQLWLEDHEIEVNEEQEELNNKAKKNGVTASNCVKARSAKPKTQRERVKKEDPTKENIINALVEALPALIAAENVEILNKGKLISFTIGEETFKLDLIRQRQTAKK